MDPFLMVVLTSIVSAVVSSALTAVATIIALKTEVAVIKALFVAHTEEDERRLAIIEHNLSALAFGKK